MQPTVLRRKDLPPAITVRCTPAGTTHIRPSVSALQGFCVRTARSCTGGCCGAGFRQLSVNYGERYVDLLINANVSDSAFRSANPNLDPRALIPGQRYCAPPAGSRQPVCTGRQYTVRDGENLAMLAQRFNVTEFELITRNPNLTPNDFAPGRVICI